MTILPKFEVLEDRIVLDAEPDVSITGASTVDIGQQGVEYTLTFDNTGDDIGYVPYIDLVLPTTGTDGAGAQVDDGVTFAGATFLGDPATTQSLTFDANGEAVHPFAVDAAGNPLVVSGTAGDTLVVISLPFGSFSPGNPAVDVKVQLNFSDLADLDAPLTLKATGGFALGEDALDNPSGDDGIAGNGDDDPSIVSTNEASLVVTPKLFTLTKTNDMPENEAATGESYIYEHTIKIDVADGQTLTDFVLTDSLPHNIVYMGGLSAPGGTVLAEPNVGDQISIANDEIKIEFASISGTKIVKFKFYIPEKTLDTPAEAIIDPTSGDDDEMTNRVDGTAKWNPIDGRDGTGVDVTASAANKYTISSLALQKGSALTGDADGNGVISVGDTVTFTIDVQVSDYFTYGDLVVTDVLGNGWLYVANSASFTTVQDNGQSIITPVSLTPHETTTSLEVQDPNSADPNDTVLTGETKNVWNLSNALTAQGQSGLLQGGAVDGTLGTSQTTVRITYQATVGVDIANPGTNSDHRRQSWPR